MKNFNNFLEEKNENVQILRLAELVETTKFPLEDYLEWYVEEGMHMDEEEFEKVHEAIFPALAAGAAGAGVYNAGKYLWNNWSNIKNKASTWWRNTQFNYTKGQAINALSKLRDMGTSMGLSSQDRRSYNKLLGMLIKRLDYLSPESIQQLAASQGQQAQPTGQTQAPAQQTQAQAAPQQQTDFSKPLYVGGFTG